MVRVVQAVVGWSAAMTSLVHRLLPSQPWARIQPLLPPHHRAPRRPPPCPRPQLRGRVAAYGPHLHPWNLLPTKELGGGSATTCWRRLDEWAKAGVFEQLPALLLDELGEAGRIDLERVSIDSFSLRAVKGGT